MPKSRSDIFKELVEAARKLGPSDRDELSSYLYTPDRRLKDKLKAVKSLSRVTDPRARGRIMEECAYLAFAGLSGRADVKSFQSAGPQHDLVLTSRSAEWMGLWRLLEIDGPYCILVECKATTAKLGDDDFARLCQILESNVKAGLGVFFTLKGASGFPERGATRQRSVRDAKLRQMLFYARTRIPVVVFDLEDILELSKHGALVVGLARKIQDAWEARGSALPITGRLADLPSHLKKLHR